MTGPASDHGAPTDAGAAARRLFELRSGPSDELAGQADAVAAACHAMAVRFHRGGKLVVFGTGGASTDAQHVAVEFVHPVIVHRYAPSLVYRPYAPPRAILVRPPMGRAYVRPPARVYAHPVPRRGG